MVYKFFDKKSTSLTDKSTAGIGVNTTLTLQNQQLAEELYKPIIKNLKKERCTQHLKKIFGVLI